MLGILDANTQAVAPYRKRMGGQGVYRGTGQA